VYSRRDTTKADIAVSVHTIATRLNPLSASLDVVDIVDFAGGLVRITEYNQVHTAALTRDLSLLAGLRNEHPRSLVVDGT
jgi:hypothetical protein